MQQDAIPEWWQRGPIDGIESVYQPVAHALLQSGDEVESAMVDFPTHLIWKPLFRMATVGFHIRHMKGVLDRLFTYAKGLALNEQQLDYLKHEAVENDETVTALVNAYLQQIQEALSYLKTLAADAAFVPRSIGRKKIPTTQAGLLFHAAEHLMRHTGQLLVTATVLKELNKKEAIDEE